MTITAIQVRQEINQISNGQGGPITSFGNNWREILPDYVLQAWFEPASIQHASYRYSVYLSALHTWYDELRAKELIITAKMVNGAIASVYAEDWAGITHVLGKEWLNIAPADVIEAWRWRGHGLYEIRDLAEALARWEKALIIKQQFSVKCLGEVIDSLIICNNELENALSCVHHYKDNKQMMEQIDRLSGNFVALAVRLKEVEDRPAPKFAIGNLVRTIGLTIQEKDGGWYKIKDSPNWRIEVTRWAGNKWTYGLLNQPTGFVFKSEDQLRKV